MKEAHDSMISQRLAINAGYREYHGSPMHHEFTRQTLSKNAVLIGGAGQAVRDKTSTGRIIDYQVGPRYVLTTGDATVAYNTRQVDGRVEQALRDVVMVDRRFFIVRDRIKLTTASTVSWQLHAENPILVDDTRTRLTGRSASGEGHHCGQPSRRSDHTHSIPRIWHRDRGSLSIHARNREPLQNHPIQ